MRISEIMDDLVKYEKLDESIKRETKERDELKLKLDAVFAEDGTRSELKRIFGPWLGSSEKAQKAPSKAATPTVKKSVCSSPSSSSSLSMQQTIMEFIRKNPGSTALDVKAATNIKTYSAHCCNLVKVGKLRKDEENRLFVVDVDADGDGDGGDGGSVPLSDDERRVLSLLHRNLTSTESRVGELLSIPNLAARKILYRLLELGLVERDATGAWFKTSKGLDRQSELNASTDRDHAHG